MIEELRIEEVLRMRMGLRSDIFCFFPALCIGLAIHSNVTLKGVCKTFWLSISLCHTSFSTAM